MTQTTGTPLLTQSAEPLPRHLFPARRGLIVLWIMAVLLALALARSAFAVTQADWQFNEAVRALSGGLPYETLTAVVTGIRLALAGLFLLTAGLLLSRPAHTATLLAAAALTGMPFALSLTGSADAAGFARPWGALADGLAVSLAALGVAAVFLLLFLFPDGRFSSPRMRVAFVVGLVAVAAGVVAVYASENGWWVFMLALFVLFLLGAGGQALRYEDADPAQRRRMVGFTAFVLLAPYWILLNIIGGRFPVLLLAGNYLYLAALPLGLYLGGRRGLWGKALSPRPFAGTAVALLLVSATAAGLWWRGGRAGEVDVAALAAAEPIPVLLDTDMAMDDVGALFYLARHPAVDLRAVTVNGVAFAHCRPGVHNVLGLLELAGARATPVACGREESFPGGRPAPDDWRQGADNLYGGQVVTRGRTADPRPAAELLADTVAAAPGEIVVVAIGPLTNLADAFQADPALAVQIKEIVIMGGAVNVPGNVTDGDSANEVAEWNFFADPVAADIVLASGAPITLVPLDATNDVPVSRAFYERLRANALSRPAVLTYNLMYMNQWWLDGGMYWWDTLAATLATAPGLVDVREMSLDVITDAGPEMGRTVETGNGAPVHVAVEADRQAFEALFLAVLNHE